MKNELHFGDTLNPMPGDIMAFIVSLLHICLTVLIVLPFIVIAIVHKDKRDIRIRENATHLSKDNAS